MGLVIVGSARYEVADILDRKVKIRVRFSVEERSKLTSQLIAFQKATEKISADSKESHFTAVAIAVRDCLDTIVVDDDDKKEIENALRPDVATEAILDLEDFTTILNYVLDIDEKLAEEDAGKASTGSEQS